MSDGIKGIEQGRAEFAYNCVNQVLTWNNFTFKSKTVETNQIMIKGIEIKNKAKERESFNKVFFTDPIKNYNDIKEKKSKDIKIDNNEENILKLCYKYSTEYRTNIKKIPMYIKTNGLGPTFAYIKSKAKENNSWELIYKQFTEWLNLDEKGLIKIKPGDDLVFELINKNSSEYRALTVEVLSLLNWMRRFVEGLIEGEE